MARGGARVGAGRPPKEQSRAKDREAARAAKGKQPSRAIDDGEWLTLPREGRSGRVPAWPLTKASWAPTARREMALWGRLWKSPQAVAWERIGVDVDQVALYVRYRVEAEKVDATVGVRHLVRQYGEHLGLTAPGMRMLRWKIGQPAMVSAAAPAASTATQPAAGSGPKERWRVINGDAAG